MSWYTKQWPYWSYQGGPSDYLEEIKQTNLNKKEGTNMLFAVTVIQAKRVDRAAVLYEEEEILADDTKVMATDANQATLLAGAMNAEAVLKAKEAKSKLRAIVRQLG